MGRHMKAGQVRSARDFESYACRRGCAIENGGRHKKVRRPDGHSMPYPAHPGDLGRGLLLKLLAFVGTLAAAAGLLGLIAH